MTTSVGDVPFPKAKLYVRSRPSSTSTIAPGCMAWVHHFILNGEKCVLLGVLKVVVIHHLTCPLIYHLYERQHVLHPRQSSLVRWCRSSAI